MSLNFTQTGTNFITTADEILREPFSNGNKCRRSNRMKRNYYWSIISDHFMCQYSHDFTFQMRWNEERKKSSGSHEARDSSGADTIKSVAGAPETLKEC